MSARRKPTAPQPTSRTARARVAPPPAPSGEFVSADQLADMRGQLAAIGKAQAVIEFELDGTIITANAAFLAVAGYTLDQIRGRHHRMFCDAVYRESEAYRGFWAKLGRGEYDAGQYPRVNARGEEVWLQASYNPIFDARGRPFKVVKYATDVTAQRRAAADTAGQMAAIGRVQAVIEFSLDGHILAANANFLAATGYALEEVRGRHHRMFCDADFAATPAYQELWAKMARGEYDAGQYRRLRKDGRPLWIQASYNPIFDASGRPFKVVKYATDITAQVLSARALDEAVAETRAVVDAAQAGDLSKRIPLAGKSGATAELCRGVNTLVANMGEIVGAIQVSSAAIDEAASGIADSSGALSARTAEQAASLAETAASMEELTATVSQNADNSREASRLAVGARDVATQGGRAVEQVVQVMAGINASAVKIADIVGVMDGIAFQTNVLALNAAVEAARAGDHGRGFAVVASEVRSLAQRSATAAKEIKALVADSVQQIQDGGRLATDAGRTMTEIVSSVGRVTQLMSDIARASQEQTAGIEQVGQAVSEMDAVTQQNAVLVEEATSAVQALEEEARGMAARVAHFQVKSEEPRPRARPAAEPARRVASL